MLAGRYLREVILPGFELPAEGTMCRLVKEALR